MYFYFYLFILHFQNYFTYEPRHVKTNSDCAPSEDSDQPGHLPSLIRVFAVRMKKAWVLSYPLSAQQRLWSDWADAQADLSLHWAHTHFVGFVMLGLNYSELGKPCQYAESGNIPLYIMQAIECWLCMREVVGSILSLGKVITVNFLNIRAPKTFVVITLKVEHDDFSLEYCFQKMQRELQTV